MVISTKNFWPSLDKESSTFASLVSSDIEMIYVYSYIYCLIMMENTIKERKQPCCAWTHTHFKTRNKQPQYILMDKICLCTIVNF
jgi:hypothetical protein